MCLRKHGENVRFGSLADIAARDGDVRFTPANGHSQCLHQCLLSAISRPNTGEMLSRLDLRRHPAPAEADAQC